MHESAHLGKGVAWRRRRGPLPLERPTHIALADLLRANRAPGLPPEAQITASGFIWLHVPNGEYRTKETAALLQRMGVLAGVFDFLLIGPDGSHHWLELKRSWGSEMSIGQIRFRAELKARGVSHTVARAFNEAVEYLERIGALTGVEVQ